MHIDQTVSIYKYKKKQYICIKTNNIYVYIKIEIKLMYKNLYIKTILIKIIREISNKKKDLVYRQRVVKSNVNIQTEEVILERKNPEMREQEI